MAWVMLKDSQLYNPRGKKCTGFETKTRPKVDLSWGMYNTIDNQINDYPQYATNRQKNNEIQSKSNYYTNSRSQREQLDKIVRRYDDQKMKNSFSMAELQAEILSDKEKIGPLLHKRQQDILHKRQQDTNHYQGLSQYISQHKNSDPFLNNSVHLPTQQSRGKIQFLEHSLLNPTNKRDSIGALMNNERMHEYNPLAESRASRRSSSGNKKNQSNFVFGDGKYNQFTNRAEQSKDFHTKLQQMYSYEESNKRRKASQLF